MTGQTISHYKILEKIGSGGMGVVYKAEDTRLKRLVALKFLPPHFTQDPEAKKRFINEAQSASALQHHNICTIYEINETDDDQMYISMEYLDGLTLKEVISESGLPADQAVDIILQIARGLEKAHIKGIIHRDIKPANIIITNEGVVKIVDFGLAKLTGQSKLTKAGSTPGTVAYMSPEQARGEDVSKTTDIWSLGVVFYEMICGQLPFRGDFEQAMIYLIINEEPDPLQKHVPEIPSDLIQIVNRMLEKNADSRYLSATELLSDLENYRNRLTAAGRGAFHPKSILQSAKKPRFFLPAIGIFLILLLASLWISEHQSNVRWARNVALPEIGRLVEENWRDYTEAYYLAEKAEQYIPDDPELTDLMNKSSLYINIDSEPSGAAVYIKNYKSPESEWQHLGVTAIDSIRLPVGIFRWKLEKEGYETVLAAASTWDIGVVGGGDLLIPNNFTRVLDPAGNIPAGMVRVPGAETPYGTIGDFFIDQYEITNDQYKAFVDAGGYRNREYWQHEFVKDGEVLTWEEAMAEFVDRTDRPGPSTWQAGTYPDGQGNYPVSGVSWYEAAAYAGFTGKVLPTGTHWGLARGEQTTLITWPQLGGYAILAPFSNFGNNGPVPVGSMPGITSHGVYDMAGNVREWCWNETPSGRLLRGGAWNDNTYRFTEPAQAPAFDRSAHNGFRRAFYPDPGMIPDAVTARTTFGPGKDFYEEQPVTDAIFQVYKEQFSYDNTALNDRLEVIDDSSDSWIHQRISFDAAYGNERVIIHLFLPKSAEPPYQTVVYFPGSASLFQTSSEDITDYYEFPLFLSYLVKSGRAVAYPVYQGTFERRDDAFIPTFLNNNSHQYTDFTVQLVKDFKRSIDYLETHSDIDSGKIAYYGMSWGGLYGAIIPAVESRVKASVLVAGSLQDRGRPEAHQITYVGRVTVPTLMMNGKYDTIQSYETSVKPMFDLLGTPEEQKKLLLYETDHIPPKNEFIKETLAWLDRYLGPVQ
jgi:eukaryotic-like serine/threonine-protein kinase